VTDEYISVFVTVKMHKALSKVRKRVRWKMVGCGSDVPISMNLIFIQNSKDLMSALLSARYNIGFLI
jgi:hypothetical protein